VWKPKPVKRARTLRRNATDAENALWRKLRDRSLRGQKFRRQFPVGRYIVDFVCIEERLIVELDGGQHAINTKSDATRTAALRARGYRVIRFWNNEVRSNLEGVLHVIDSSLKRPHPDPLP